MHLLYPSDPLRPKKPDADYAAEYQAVRSQGFGASTFSLEEFQGGQFEPFPALPENDEILYRGWMLNAAEYKALIAAIRGAGATPVTPLESYLATHHLPNWYQLLQDFTPETRVYPLDCDLESELRLLGWTEFFIKDYVKSLKTSVGSRITRAEQARDVIREMAHFRGAVEGGFCVRRVEDFMAETEQRFFVVDAVPYSATGEVPPLVHECATRIDSRFFSVDVIRRRDGVLRLVEVGDGQVSDLVGWTPEQFARLLQTATWSAK